MISLISDALIIPGLSHLDGGPEMAPIPLGARRAPAKPWRASIPASFLPALAARESFLHSGQLSVETAVGHEAADLGHQTAEEVGIDAVLDDDRLAEGRAQARGERRTLRFGEGDRTADSRAYAAGVGIDEVAVRIGDVRQLLAAALIGHQSHEITDELRHAEALRDLVGHRPLGRRRDPRPGEKLQQRGIPTGHLDDGAELVADHVRLMALPGQLEQRLGVRARGVLRLHRPIRAIESSTMRRWSSSRRLLRMSFSATLMAISLTSRRSSSRARRTSLSICALAASTSCCASRRAASTSLRCSSPASFSAAARIACASAYAARSRPAFSSCCRAASARAASAASSEVLMARVRSSILASSGL